MNLFDHLATFGPTCTEDDVPRLLTQLEQIKTYMQTHDWSTLAEIEVSTGSPQSSISAQLRHLRKAKFGGYTIEKRRRVAGGGTWEYRLSDPCLDLGLDIDREKL